MFEDIDPLVILLVFTAVIFGVSLLGAYIPVMLRAGPRIIHLMVAFSAGVFLGILFFMLMPEAFEEAPDGMLAVSWILVGFLVVLFINVILKQMHIETCPCEECKEDEHAHDLTSFSAFAGLAIHAAIDGMILAVGISEGDEMGMFALIAISIHKFVEVFSLSSTFMLTDMKKKKALIYMIAFSLITPIAAFVSMPIVEMLHEVNVFIPLAIATGTFMYVTIYDLLPEAFHKQKDTLASSLLVLAGITLIAMIVLLLSLGSAHVH